MKEAKKTVSAREQYRQRVAAAMPDVREVVKKHGLSLVSGCLTRLRNYNRKAEQAEKLRKEADKLEQELEGATTVKLRSAG